MSDMIFGLLLLGTFSGVIPVIVLLLLIKGMILLFKGLKESAKVLAEREAPVPVVRNIREELWDERDADTRKQYLQDVKDRRERNAV